MDGHASHNQSLRKSYLDNSAIWEPEEVSMELAQSVQMERVDGHVCRDLFPSLFQLFVFHAIFIPNTLFHLFQSSDNSD